MNRSLAQLTDLPDELLLIILKKLENTDVLYSLLGLYTRLDQTIRDPCFTTEIDLIKANEAQSTRMDTLIDRFCMDILPEIHHRIRWLKLRSTTMERILLAAHYSNLSQLDIFIPDNEPILPFGDELSLVQRFKDHILTISITGDEKLMDFAKMNVRGDLFSYIFMIFTHIQRLHFYPDAPYICSHVFFAEQLSMFSSTLVELHINTYLFEHCLYLLDGRFDQLRTFVVGTVHMRSLQWSQINTKQFIKLKEFSLTCCNTIDAYDEVILPIVQRMVNLEKLSLFLVIDYDRRFIDGNHLKENVLRHLPRLEDFLFNIRSIIPLAVDLVHLPSNEDIRCTLTDLTKHPVISYVDYFRNDGYGHCHIYTSPYSLIKYEYVSNSVPSELFRNVRHVSLFDERPFEHSFFLRLAQSFPSMKTLTVNNEAAQQEKQHDQSYDEKERVPMIRYPSLRKLYLLCVHDDYVEQFFFDTRTFFSNDMHVSIHPSQLKRVTHDYMRAETRLNYSKVKSFYFYDEIDWSKLL